MNFEIIEDNMLFITNNSSKNYLIKKINQIPKILNVKVITPRELIENYYFKYDEQAIYYLMNKYKIKYDIAKIYLNNMYYVNEPNSIEKINNIYNLKKELIDNNLLIFNSYYNEYLKTKKIIVYNINNLSNIVKTILDKFEYEIVNDYSGIYKHDIYEYKTLEDEVIGCAIKCINLIKKVLILIKYI